MLILDILLLSAVFLAWKISKRPKKEAVLACFISLILVETYSYANLTGVFPYYLALLTELVCSMGLFLAGTYQRKSHDRMYYFALSSFLLMSSFITGFYIIDFGPYASHALYAGTSRALGITHVIFMLALSDGIIESGIFSKMSGWFNNAYFRNHPHS